MKGPKKRLRLRQNAITGGHIVPQEFGLLRYLVELFAPERCHLITRTLDDKGALYRLNSEGELILREFLTLCQRRDLGKLARETFKRNPKLNLPSFITRLQEASKDLLEANDQCKALPLQPEPAFGFPDDVWERMMTDANEALLAYQSILHELFRELHSMYTYL